MFHPSDNLAFILSSHFHLPVLTFYALGRLMIALGHIPGIWAHTRAPSVELMLHCNHTGHSDTTGCTPALALLLLCF